MDSAHAPVYGQSRAWNGNSSGSPSGGRRCTSAHRPPAAGPGPAHCGCCLSCCGLVRGGVGAVRSGPGPGAALRHPAARRPDGTAPRHPGPAAAPPLACASAGRSPRGPGPGAAAARAAARRPGRPRPGAAAGHAAEEGRRCLTGQLPKHHRPDRRGHADLCPERLDDLRHGRPTAHFSGGDHRPGHGGLFDAHRPGSGPTRRSSYHGSSGGPSSSCSCSICRASTGLPYPLVTQVPATIAQFLLTQAPTAPDEDQVIGMIESVMEAGIEGAGRVWQDASYFSLTPYIISSLLLLDRAAARHRRHGPADPLQTGRGHPLGRGPVSSWACGCSMSARGCSRAGSASSSPLPWCRSSSTA